MTGIPSCKYKRLAALTADYRISVVALNESVKIRSDRIVELEAERDALKAERDTLKAERDTLKAEVKVRTSERDALQVHYESFRKNIKELLGQAESSLGAPRAPVLVGTAGN